MEEGRKENARMTTTEAGGTAANTYQSGKKTEKFYPHLDRYKKKSTSKKDKMYWW